MVKKDAKTQMAEFKTHKANSDEIIIFRFAAISLQANIMVSLPVKDASHFSKDQSDEI